jgi:protease-4
MQENLKAQLNLFRVTKMTEPNRLQTTDMLNDLYGNFLLQTSKARDIDTATLHQLAITGKIQTANDALQNKLVDGLRYDDEVKAEIAQKIGQREKDKINFIALGTYAKAIDFTKNDGSDKIAIIYAQGDIVDGKSQDKEIGSEDYVNIIRRLRFDDDVKAIVFRVNSPGGSSLASDKIWREIALAKKQKPVVVSMGDLCSFRRILYFLRCRFNFCRCKYHHRFDRRI